MPKTGKAGASPSGSSQAAGGGGVVDTADGDSSSSSSNNNNSGSDSRGDAARVLSTVSGAAFAADGVGREIAGLFTATSDGIFF